MTTPAIHWSELDQRFWVNDGDEVLWFDSVLDAKGAVREIELRQAVKAERDRIVAWLRRYPAEVHQLERDNMFADAIEAGVHWESSYGK